MNTEEMSFNVTSTCCRARRAVTDMHKINIGTVGMSQLCNKRGWRCRVCTEQRTTSISSIGIRKKYKPKANVASVRDDAARQP